jgi:hypothetical protein
MSVRGERFRKLNGAQHLEVTDHALRRIRQRAGMRLSEREALALFLNARQMRTEDLLVLGYRPAYGRRLRQGQKSWYFRLPLRGCEMIAVIGQRYDGSIAWVTTYAPNAQTEELRATTNDAVPALASW